MRHAATTIALAATAIATAACGHSGSASTSSSGPPPAPQLQSSGLVLQRSDVGAGFAVVPAQTRVASLADTSKGDPQGIRLLEQQNYLNAYQTLFATPRAEGVQSSVIVYRSTAATQVIIRAWRREVPKQLSGVRSVVSLRSPGADSFLVRGVTREHRKLVPVYAVEWMQGAVIGTVTVFGPGATQAHTLALARIQAARIQSAQNA